MAIPHGGQPRADLDPGLRAVPFERSATLADRVEADRARLVTTLDGGRDFEALYHGYPTGDG
ncbi:hypothetical protein [Methylorubrum populi]|uniref:hypothetical protein n=1 Tax=Methylorubrum populi TaxID=223967 RepID=UPI003F65FCB7